MEEDLSKEGRRSCSEQHAANLLQPQYETGGRTIAPQHLPKGKK